MRLTAVVDRIEEDAWAVLLVGEEQRRVNWPVDLLPQPVREGAVLSLEWRAEPDGTAAAQAEAEALLADLLGKDK